MLRCLLGRPLERKNVAKLVLASSSVYRRSLLERLALPFDVASPAIDETALPEETPEQLVARLAEAKARVVADARPGAIVIGSDQVAISEADILGKPGDRDRAIAQLESLSGRNVRFLTSLCVLSPDLPPLVEIEASTVCFRHLTTHEINTYVDREQPFDCAGSFKSEGLGIALFESIEGDDPNALIGLPLIRLCRMLRIVGLDPLSQQV